MRARTFVVLLVLAAAFVGGVYWAGKQKQVQPQAEATGNVRLVASGGCSGSGCNGKDPADLCGDGITVASEDIKGMGLLELRYSRSCKANWGRFTAYTSLLPWIANATIYAKVTVWNPGRESYLTAHHGTGKNSSWSYMTDGNPKACTGVEIVIVNQKGNDYKIEDEYPDGQIDTSGDSRSLGWTWGPCY